MNAIIKTKPERKPLDGYYTPPALAANLVDRLYADGFVESGASALEPSVGMGAFVHALSSRDIQRLDIIDVNPHAIAWTRIPLPDHVHCVASVGDFLTQSGFGEYDLIVGNPPYSQAEAHARKALSLRGKGGCVAFLLRLAFLESQERFAFWYEFPASKIYVLSERPTFTGGGTDNAAYGFFIWHRGHRGPTTLEVISWR